MQMSTLFTYYTCKIQPDSKYYLVFCYEVMFSRYNWCPWWRPALQINSTCLSVRSADHILNLHPQLFIRGCILKIRTGPIGVKFKICSSCIIDGPELLG